MISASHYDRQTEDLLPPRYSTRPNSTDDDNNRVRDAEEGRNGRRSLTFVESSFVDVPEPAHVHQHQRAHVVTTTEVQMTQPPPNQAPARSRLRMRLTRRGDRSKSMCLMFVHCDSDTMLIVGCRGISLLGCLRLLCLFHLRGGFRQVAFGAAGEDCEEHVKHLKAYCSTQNMEPSRPVDNVVGGCLSVPAGTHLPLVAQNAHTLMENMS